MKMNIRDEEISTEKSTNRSGKSNHKCDANCNCSGAQKRPMNAFLIFCKRHRSVVKQKYPHLENRSITKILGKWWTKIDLEQKSKYTELARKYKEEFIKAHPSFKWYKTNIKLPPNMQPCSPPSSHVSFSSSAANASASLNNCNLFNNGNSPMTTAYYQNEQASSRQQSNGSNSSTLNQANLAYTPSSAVSNEKHATDKIVVPTAPNNLTPKPPKKRYLEEFKDPSAQLNNTVNPNIISNNSTTSTSTSSAINNHFNVVKPSEAAFAAASKNTIGGPPVLDIETMNQVIEDAFGASSADDKNAPSTSKSFKSKKTDSHLNLFSTQPSNDSLRKDLASSKAIQASENEVKGDKSNDLRCNEKFEPNELDKASKTNSRLTSKKSNDESRSDSPISVIDKLVNSNSPSACNMDKEKLTVKPNKKFGNNKEDDDDKPLNLSSTSTIKASNQVIIDNLIDKLLSQGTEGAPMPIEMLQSSPNNYTFTTSLSKSQQQNQQRKERSCKGKRYLEMLNENKFTNKRSKNTLTSSICGGKGDEMNGISTSFSKNVNSSNSSSGSKWVSGNFDLEEHIAALPQLGDNHLASVLDQATKSGLKSPSDLQISSYQIEGSNNVLLNNNVHNLRKESSITRDDKLEAATDYLDTAKQPNENINENRLVDPQLSNSSNDLAEKIVERLNINSQSLECEGLVALAEVALSQHRHISSPSCT